jgi:Zn-dependent peptidase ImmA (M78 family)
MQLVQLLREMEDRVIISDFVKFVATELALDGLPKKITLTDKSLDSTFGTYSIDTDEIVVSVANRHLVDVLRTLAHEMVHHKQQEMGIVLDGSDGSSVENEANAAAGLLLRKFKDIIPEIYGES